MNTYGAKDVSRTARVGWAILFIVSMLLVLHGVFWGFAGPQLALENITERISAARSEFQVGSPSAYDVITLSSRNFAIVEVALGLMALLSAWMGYRDASTWAWRANAVLVAGLAAMSVNFVVVGGLAGGSIGYLGITLLALLGLLMARGR